MNDIVLYGLFGLGSAFIAAVAALLGVFITQYYESRKRKSEELRWYTDYFLGKKIDTLNNLHIALHDCFYALNFYGNNPPTKLQEFNENVQSKVDSYLKALVLASVYLNDEGNSLMADCLRSFRQASFAIFLSLPDDQCKANKESYISSTRYLDWKGLGGNYDNAKAYLKEILNPKSLIEVENRTNDKIQDKSIFRSLKACIRR